MDTKTLPTTPVAVNSWLRDMVPHVIDAKPGTAYYTENVYAYLFGMATVKLAEAHRRIEILEHDTQESK